MKDYNHIEKLLERFYNAETSEQEEQELKDFFHHGEVPPHLQAEKEMFLQLQASDTPEGMEERLGNLIDQWELSEQQTQRKHSRQSFVGHRHEFVSSRASTERHLRHPRRSVCTCRESIGHVFRSIEQRHPPHPKHGENQ